MVYSVSWSQAVARKLADTFGTARSATGRPSSYDFIERPLRRAVVAFREFDDAVEEAGSSVRSVGVFDEVFGPTVFIGMLTAPGTVEIVDFSIDPDYWEAARRESVEDEEEEGG